MLQRLLDTVSLTGGQWLIVIALSIVAPALVGIDKAIQLARQNKAPRSCGRRTRVMGDKGVVGVQQAELVEDRELVQY